MKNKRDEISRPAVRTRLERAEARIERAEIRTEQAEMRTARAVTRIETAETRTEQAVTRIELAETRAEHAESRTEFAKSRADEAETRAEQAESTLQRLSRMGNNEPSLDLAADLLALDTLTHRQREILKFIAQGENTKHMADLLKLSPKTVDYHRLRIMDRLDIHDVAGLVRFALRVGLSSADRPPVRNGQGIL